MTKLAALACGAALLLVPSAARATRGAQPRLHVLAFTKTAAFRHDSIPAALRALRELGATNGIAVDATEDGDVFTDARLTRYDAVLFLLTTGDVLDDAQQSAFERYVSRGGGYAGVHSASDTEYGWPWYGKLVGAYFSSHPAVQRAAIDVLAREASSVRLPRRWVRTDEWYSFASSDRARQGSRTARRELLRSRWKRDGRRPPDRLGPPGRQGARLVYGWRAYRGGVRRAALPGSPARRGPLRRGLLGAEICLGGRHDRQ